MKFLLIAAFIVVASANPGRLIVPGPAGPAPVIDPPMIEESESPISVGPAIVDHVEPVSSPLVQVIINVKSRAAVAESPVVIEDHESSPSAVEPSPVIIVDNVEEIVEQPIVNAPVFPSPVVVLPDALN